MANTDDLKQYEETLKNISQKQTMELREEIKNRSFKLLKWEFIFLVLLIVLQGLGGIPSIPLWNGKSTVNITFYLNNWVIGTFLNAYLIQAFFIIRNSTRNLFPKDISSTKHAKKIPTGSPEH